MGDQVTDLCNIAVSPPFRAVCLLRCLQEWRRGSACAGRRPGVQLPGRGAGLDAEAGCSQATLSTHHQRSQPERRWGECQFKWRQRQQQEGVGGWRAGRVGAGSPRHTQGPYRILQEGLKLRRSGGWGRPTVPGRSLEIAAQLVSIACVARVCGAALSPQGGRDSCSWWISGLQSCCVVLPQLACFCLMMLATCNSSMRNSPGLFSTRQLTQGAAKASNTCAGG